jgi:hypothetical protein
MPIYLINLPNFDGNLRKVKVFPNYLNTFVTQQTLFPYDEDMVTYAISYSLIA